MSVVSDGRRKALVSLHTLYQSIMLPSFEGLLGGGELGMVDAAGAAAGSDMVVEDKVGGGRAGDRRVPAGSAYAADPTAPQTSWRSPTSR